VESLAQICCFTAFNWQKFGLLFELQLPRGCIAGAGLEENDHAYGKSKISLSCNLPDF